MLPHPLPHSLNLTNRSEERLIREIMAVDEVDWDEAHKQVRDGGSSPMRRWTMSSLRPFLHSLTCHPPPPPPPPSSRRLVPPTSRVWCSRLFPTTPASQPPSLEASRPSPYASTTRPPSGSMNTTSPRTSPLLTTLKLGSRLAPGRGTGWR